MTVNSTSQWRQERSWKSVADQAFDSLADHGLVEERIPFEKSGLHPTVYQKGFERVWIGLTANKVKMASEPSWRCGKLSSSRESAHDNS